MLNPKQKSMSNFKVGQKVVCVEPIDTLVLNDMYTISRLNTCICNEVSVSVAEYKNDNNYAGVKCKCGHIFYCANDFRSNRFRPLDHEFADKVEAMIKEQVKQEQLETV